MERRGAAGLRIGRRRRMIGLVTIGTVLNYLAVIALDRRTDAQTGNGDIDATT